MNTEDVIFVGGSGRSGTTLISELLDMHPEAAAIFEVWTLITFLHYFREDRLPNAGLDDLDRENTEYALSPASEYNWRFRKEETAQAWSGKVKAALAAGQPLPVAIRQWADYLHRLQMARDGSTRIIHKTPALAVYLPEIWQLWPSGHFLHMIRDPRAVIASYLVQDWGPVNIEEGIAWYCGRVGPALQNGRGDQRYLEVKLEEMVEHPAEVLDQIQQWAGLVPATARMLMQRYMKPEVIHHWKNQLDRKSADWIYEETVNRIPAIGELYGR